MLQVHKKTHINTFLKRYKWDREIVFTFRGVLILVVFTMKGFTLVWYCRSVAGANRSTASEKQAIYKLTGTSTKGIMEIVNQETVFTSQRSFHNKRFHNESFALSVCFRHK